MDIQPDTTTLSTRLLPDTATFSDDIIHIADHSVFSLVQEFGTPLYIFDRATIVNACASYFHAFHECYHASAFAILYASKAYLSPLIAQLMAQRSG